MEGFQSISASKDVGIISAVQMSGIPARACPLNVVIKKRKPAGLRVDVTLRLGDGLRTSASAVKALMCKLLGAIVPGAAEGANDGSSAVSVQTSSGYTPLAGATGESRQAGFGPVALFFLVFRGASADTVTSVARPVIRIPEDTPDIRKRFALVQLEADDDDTRSLKIGSMRTLGRALFTGNTKLPPDSSWTVAYTSTRTPDGLWEIVPNRNLDPGEYGVFDLDAYIVFAFRRE